jgi:putative PIN family toxin of toxin-antitoxin system
VRAVIDTNVLVAALLWRGPPHALLAQARAGTLTLISSPALLAELAGVLARPKFASIVKRVGASPDELMNQVRPLVEVIAPPPLPE